MSMFKIVIVAALVSTGSIGCVVHAGHGRSVRQAPAARQMTYNEAVGSARDYARSRGYQVVRVQNAHRTGNDVWKVKLDVERPGARGKLHLDYNAWSGELIRADEKVKADNRRGAPGKGNGNGHYHGATAVTDRD